MAIVVSKHVDCDTVDDAWLGFSADGTIGSRAPSSIHTIGLIAMTLDVMACLPAIAPNHFGRLDRPHTLPWLTLCGSTC